MEIQPNNLFANEQKTIKTSVEPSPRFGDHHEFNLSPKATLNKTYLNQLNLIDSNQLQEFLKNNIMNSERGKSNQKNNNKDGIYINKMDNDIDCNQFIVSNSLRNSIQVDNSQPNQQKASVLYQQQNCSTQDDLHDFSFSQQLDNSICCLEEQSSIQYNNNINNNDNTTSNIINMSNSNNFLDSVKRKPRGGCKERKLGDEDNNYIIDSDMDSILMQSPPSNNQDAFKKFCQNMGGVRESTQSFLSLKHAIVLKENKNQIIHNSKHNNQLLSTTTQTTDNISVNSKQSSGSSVNGIQIAFQQSLALIESKWSDFQKWPESSPLRIDLFALEMQSVYGSYYRNKIKVDELIHNLVKEESNRLAYIEAWKHKFRKTQKETMLNYIQQVEKNREFLDTLNLFSNNDNPKKQKLSQSQLPQQTSQQPKIVLTQKSQQSNHIASDQKLNHQQSLEDLSPRQPPIMIQNNSQHKDYVSLQSSKSQHRRTRDERGRSKTPPGALQQQNQKQKSNISIPKLDINASKNNAIPTIESCRDELQTTKQSKDQLHLTKITKQAKQKDFAICNTTGFNSISASNQLSPQSTHKNNIINTNNRVSVGYKNPFKKLVQQKQKLKNLLSPTSLSRHNFTGSNYMSPSQQTIDNQNSDLDQVYHQSKTQSYKQSNPIQPYYQSPRSNFTTNTQDNVNKDSKQSKNSSNESSPDMPAQLDHGRLSVYSQNHLLSSNTAISKNINTNSQIKQKQYNQQQIINQASNVPNLQINLIEQKNQLATNIEYLQDDQILQQKQQMKETNDYNQEEYIASYRSQQLQQEEESMYEELIDQNDEFDQTQNQDKKCTSFSSPDKISTKSVVDETQQNIQISQNINQNSPLNNTDLDSFIQCEILLSDRSQKQTKPQLEALQQIDQSDTQQQVYSDNEDIQFKINKQKIQQDINQHETLIRDDKTQQEQQQQSNNSVLIEDYPLQIVQDDIQDSSYQQQDQISLQENSVKHTMDYTLQLVQLTQHEDNQHYCYQTQENEIYPVQEVQVDDCQFYPKYNNLSLTPQNKTKKSSFVFMKPRSKIQGGDKNEYEENHNFDVFSQQDVMQQGKFSPCLSRISRLKKRKNYCFQNYVTIQNFDKPQQSDKKQQDKNKCKTNSISIQQNEDNFEQLDLDKISPQLFDIVTAYNQSDSIFNSSLLIKQTINDIIKYQDETSSLYTISELRLDSQLQLYFRDVFKLTINDYKKYSLIKSHANFYIPNANKLYQTFLNPDNRIYSQAGDVKIQTINNDNNSYTITKTLKKYEGLMRSRQDDMIYQTQQLKEEDGLILIIKSNQEQQSIFKRFSIFQKDYDNFIQIIKMKTIEQGTRTGDKDLVDIKMFYCVDYKLLIDDELKQNNLNIAIQEVKEFMDGIRVFDREL